MENAHLARAFILLDRRRYELAEKELRQALAIEPNSALALACLSLSIKGSSRLAESEAAARAAIELDPEADLGYYALARALSQQQRVDEALAAAREAIRLQPDDADYHGQEGLNLAVKRDFRGALESANRGLAVDPDSAVCLALRAMVTYITGEMVDAEQTTLAILADEPDSPLGHAVRGWILLERGDTPRALEHFAQSLCIDPHEEFALTGMAEAMKSRYRVYRCSFLLTNGLGRLGGGYQFLLAVGLIFVVNVVRRLGRHGEGDTVRWLAGVTTFLYVGFVYVTWISRPVSNVLLGMTRWGRMLLSKEDKLGAICVAASLALAAMFALLIIATTWQDVGKSGTACFLFLTLLVAGSFSAPVGWPRYLVGAITGGLLAWTIVGLTVAATAILVFHPENPESNIAFLTMLGTAVGVALGAWIRAVIGWIRKF